MSEDRLNRQDWIKAGLRALAGSGVQALKAESLAKQLGVSRGSFYWHFVDVAAYHAALLESWEENATARVIQQVEDVESGVTDQLRLLAQLAFSTEGLLERQVRAWASQQAMAAEVQDRVDKTRMDFVTRLFEKAGMTPEAARLRSRLFYLALIGRYAAGKRLEIEPHEITLMVGLLTARESEK